MGTPVVAFFNNKGGVGKTSLVYHLSWMYADLGHRVVAVDLDPQANLTTAFLAEERLEALWPDGPHPLTVFGCIHPLMKGVGDVGPPHVERLSLMLSLVVGDLALAGFEDELSGVWPQCMDGKERGFRVTSAFWRTMQTAGDAERADVVLMDMGPNLGAINRAALIASDYVVVPLSADLFSLQGLRNLGPTLRDWRRQWRERVPRNPDPSLALPAGAMSPIGYVVQQHSVRLDRPVQAYDRWIGRIPEVYHQEVLDEPGGRPGSPADDPACLAQLKHYRSLMAMAHESQKPIFHLKAADGAIGSHAQAAQSAYQDFRALADEIARRTGIAAS